MYMIWICLFATLFSPLCGFSFNATEEFDTTPAKQLFWDDFVIIVGRNVDHVIPVEYIHDFVDNWVIFAGVGVIVAGLLMYCYSQMADTIYNAQLTCGVLFIQTIFTIFSVAYFSDVR